MANEALLYNAVNIAVQTQYKTLQKFKEKHGSWEKVWEEIKASKNPQFDPEAEFQKLEKLGIKVILKDDASYPPLLKETSFPPFALYVRGTLPSFGLSLAIIGTRKATTEGKELAREFGRELAKNGFVIVSGLALGIDSMGHRGALEGSGRAVAVLANGLDHIYPSTNTALGEEIIRQGGVLISEYPLGSPSLPYHFLERNRIISGLSKGVLIIEAPARSGTLATARFALEDNREVFVIPGPARHPNFAISHELIKQGASLVTVPEDILKSFGLVAKDKKETADLSPEEALLLNLLKKSAASLSIDKMIELSHLQTPIVNQLVSVLILKGLIQETENGYATI